MAIWFVRPNTSHSGTRNGSTSEAAWGGWSEVEWGPGKVNTGDTLYVIGAHSYGSIIAIGNATSSATGVTIRGDHASGAGSMTFSGGSFYLNVNKNNTTIQSLTITSSGRCIVPSGTPLVGFTIKNCTLNGSNVPAIEFLAVNDWGWTDTLIDGNTFNCGSGGSITGIAWWPQSPVNTYHERLKITNNNFIGGAGNQGVSAFLAHPNALEVSPGVPSNVHMYDVEIIGNTFTNCGGTAIKAYVPEYGRNRGLKVQRNRMINMKRVGDLGGGIAVGGFIQSTTAGFGPNVIEHNYADGLEGTSGFANIMYGSYIARYNTAKNISSIIYDGVGLLFDLGANGCVAHSNYFENLSGTPGDFSAGAGIGVIFSATNITCYGNVIKNCHVGVLYGNQSSGSVSNIFNNTFINCKLAGVFGNETTHPTDANVVKNNVFTAGDPTAKAIRYLSGAWNKESTNVFHGFAVGTQALHATSKSSDPQISSEGRPKAGSPVIAAGAHIQRCAGADRKTFQNPPSIGAYEYVRPRGTRL